MGDMGVIRGLFLCWLEACLAEGSLMASAGHLGVRVLPARPPARAARVAALGLGPHRLLDCVAPPLAGRGHPNHPLAMGLPKSGCEPRASLPLSLVGSRRSSLTMPGQPADKASLLHALYFRHKKSICDMPFANVHCSATAGLQMNVLLFPALQACSLSYPAAVPPIPQSDRAAGRVSALPLQHV